MSLRRFGALTAGLSGGSRFAAALTEERGQVDGEKIFARWAG